MLVRCTKQISAGVLQLHIATTNVAFFVNHCRQSLVVYVAHSTAVACFQSSLHENQGLSRPYYFSDMHAPPHDFRVIFGVNVDLLPAKMQQTRVGVLGMMSSSCMIRSPCNQGENSALLRL